MNRKGSYKNKIIYYIDIYINIVIILIEINNTFKRYKN